MNVEEFTAPNILTRLLSRVSADLDKREGSIIYDALAPAAWEMASIYRLLFNAYDESFISTATGASLDKRVGEMGITRRNATKAICKGVFKDTAGNSLDITVGDRFTSLDPYMAITYVVIDKISAGAYRLEAVESGSMANKYLGPLSPVTHITGLGSAEITEILIPGEDAESDDALRARYISFITNEMQDGNTAQYQYWADNFDGIGRAKVFPCWNGANTVKVSILDSNNEKASSDLITAFQHYLDPDSQGLGNGVAPIGAKVTVSTATEVTVNISLSVSLKNGYLLADVEDSITKAINRYLSEYAYQRNAIYYVDIGSAILNAEGVSTVSDLQLNNAQSDVALGAEKIGKMGILTVAEVTA